MQNTLNLSVQGMHCGACVRRVTAALEAVPRVRVESVEVGSARIGYDPAEATPEGIVASINRIGFQASVQ
ncbi:heavy metal-associated domain-containing protein [Edaphobacter sp.]|uniref:heavy-metal-associated domain-containing protein n=1 Tax=Edaphobacter sp. TaxID=1934404 RepID=UPI002DBC1250|nr:heavy metal-associated domain-containing protein [Edaphobacter sp.]HEU5341875.1 heavy metal-associated domain-containing protein [Edaphobacter sp.]